jgi:hypothetical protein
MAVLSSCSSTSERVEFRPTNVFESSIGLSESEFFSRSETSLSECMRKLGFEYFPRKQKAELPPDAILSDGTLDDSQFAKVYGFGITTFSEGVQFSVDPNDEIFESLESEERKAYLRALVGSPDGGSSSSTSCKGKLPSARPTPVLTRLESELAVKLLEVRQSLNVRKLYDGWSKCFVQLTGKNYEDPDKVFLAFVEESNRLESRAELANEERAFATASLKCRKEFLGSLPGLEQEVIDRFLEENSMRIPKLEAVWGD